jgi:hypothetical protein
VLAPNAGEIRWRGQQMNDELRNYLGHMLQDHGQTFFSIVRRRRLARR